MAYPNDTESETLIEGTTLGRYEIRRLIGRGGMGCVYEALHRDLKKRVAIKTLLPSLAANHEARMRFLREGEAASRIRHPNVVDVTDVGVEGSTSYLVMEYLDGEDLSTYIARHGPLSPAQTADIMLPVSAAISTAHDQGVIHRDLKPANIFLATSAVSGVLPKVLDFGISKVMGDRGTMVLTGTGATFGTTFYLPPEQLQAAKQADAKSDQYALGTILYECVTGQRAFEHDNLYTVLKDIAEGRYVAPRVRRPDLPVAMEALIKRAMSLDPSARFPSVKDLGATLLEFANPQARMLWSTFFGNAPTRDEPQGLGYGLAGGTMVLPPAEEVSRRISKLTPQPARRLSQSRSNSTLGNATGESASPFNTVPNLRKSRAPLFLGIGVVAIAGVTVAILQFGQGASRISPSGAASTTGPARVEHPQPPPPPTFRVELETDPREATIELDGRPAGTGALDQRLPSDGTSHVIVARAPGYRDSTVRFTDRPPQHLLTLDPVAAQKPSATESTTGRTAGGHAAHPDESTTPDRPTKPTTPHAVSHSSEGHEPKRGGRNKHKPAGGGESGAKPNQDPNRTANGAPIID